MPDRQLFSRNAASAAHFRSASVNYVRLIESADRRFMSDRIAGIFFFRPIPTLPANPPSCHCRHQPSRCRLSTFVLPDDSELLPKHHSVEKFLKNRTGARDARYWISPTIGLTAHKRELGFHIVSSHVRDFRLKLHSHKNFHSFSLFIFLCAR